MSALAAAGLVVMVAVPAQGQMVDATAPGVLADILRQEGYSAKLETDKVGDPIIQSASHGVTWAIYFYDCNSDGRYCKDIQFAAGFDKNRPTELARINEWNRGKRFGKAYLDEEGDPFIEYDLTFEGGVSRSNVSAALKIWGMVLNEYTTFIDWN